MKKFVVAGLALVVLFGAIWFGFSAMNNSDELCDQDLVEAYAAKFYGEDCYVVIDPEIEDEYYVYYRIYDSNSNRCIADCYSSRAYLANICD